MIIRVRDIYELIWLKAIKEKSSCNMKIKSAGNQTHFLDSSTRKSHQILREIIWHLNVHRKMSLPSIGKLPTAPDDLRCARTFSWFSGNRTSGKRVSKVLKIIAAKTKFSCSPQQHLSIEPGKVGLLEKPKLLRSSTAREMVELWYQLELCAETNILDDSWVYFQTLGTFSRFSHP